MRRSVSVASHRSAHKLIAIVLDNCDDGLGGQQQCARDQLDAHKPMIVNLDGVHLVYIYLYKYLEHCRGQPLMSVNYN